MERYKRKLKEWYDSTAERYERWGEHDEEYSPESRPVQIKRFNELLDMVEVTPHTTVLDVAAGTGIYLFEVLHRGGMGYAVDISGKMLAQLKKKRDSLELEGKICDITRGDAQTLPFTDNMFDVVLCMGMCEYYPLNKISQFLEEMKRVMKGDGRIIVDFPNHENEEVYTFREKERSVGHEIYVNDTDTIIGFLEENGLSVLHHHEAGIERQFLLKLKDGK